MTDHECLFPEVVIGGDEEYDGEAILKKGDRVLAPCQECGESPLDDMQFKEGHIRELQESLLEASRVTVLYHWSPISRRKQILRYGLMPNRRSTTNSDYRAGHVCFADSPSWAWALSAGMGWTPEGEWDLWQTSLDVLDGDKVHVLASPERKSGIYEVRFEGRVWKRQIWHVGTRVKPGRNR